MQELINIFRVHWTGPRLLAFFIAVAYLVYMDRGESLLGSLDIVNSSYHIMVVATIHSDAPCRRDCVERSAGRGTRGI